MLRNFRSNNFFLLCSPFLLRSTLSFWFLFRIFSSLHFFFARVRARVRNKGTKMIKKPMEWMENLIQASNFCCCFSFTLTLTQINCQPTNRIQIITNTKNKTKLLDGECLLFLFLINVCRRFSAYTSFRSEFVAFVVAWYLSCRFSARIRLSGRNWRGT